MKFPRIIQAVYWQPWLITPQAHAAVRALLENRLSEGYRAGMFDLEDDDEPQDAYTVRDGVAVIPVEGAILRKASALERMCGAVGTEQIEEALLEAEADSKVAGIVLDVDSPGGTVGGVPEIGNLLVNCRKTVVAYTAGQMCSAAYWLAAGADKIVASPSAEVGSIGVYLPWIDQTIRYALAGYKVDIIRNDGADLKGMGYPGTSLTPEQREHLQAGVNEIAAMFHSHVKAHRGNISDDTMRGQAFLADDAMNRGLIDDTGSLTDAIRFAHS
jgi:signal peptide peptidase SppA